MTSRTILLWAGLCFLLLRCDNNNPGTTIKPDNSAAIENRLAKLTSDRKNLSDENTVSVGEDLSSASNTLYLLVQTTVSRLYFKIIILPDSTAELEGKMYEPSDEIVDKDSAFRMSHKYMNTLKKLTVDEVSQMLQLLTSDTCCLHPLSVSDTSLIDLMLSRKKEISQPRKYAITASGLWNQRNISYFYAFDSRRAKPLYAENSIFILDRVKQGNYSRFCIVNPENDNPIYRLSLLLLDFSGLMKQK